ncbi:MAG TPA: Stk1 family PASTA domain-containing Ser/Thr kinase [Micromonosporaceae bacterium]
MDTTVADALLGSLVDGRYRVRGRVARGGMATVYTAVDERLERTVALKIIHPGQADDPRFVDRFTREAKTIARLTHPNIVAVYDQGTHEGLPYLVMEFVRGRTLRDILTETGRMDPSDALVVLEQMLAAVAAAHRAGVVHRDVKPENVLVAESPGGTGLVDAVVKVADFGLARAVEASADDGDGQLLATVAYVAPELVTDGRADPRGDVYSVGIVLFEMLTGRVPYDGGKPIEVAWRHVDQDVPPPSRYVTDLPAELDRLVRQATSRDPAGRPVDAGAMLAEVQSAHDAIDANSSLRGRTLAQPTLLVETVGDAGSSTTRPAWSKLPEPKAADRPSPTPGRRRADTHRPAASRRPTRRPPAQVSSPAAVWFAGFMSRPNGRRTFYATLAVLALVITLTGWWFGFGRYSTTPGLVGRTQTQAQAMATNDGFTAKIGATVWSAKVPEGTVVSQQPPMGGRILNHGTIVLTLSKGPERYAIPNDVGEAFSAVASDLSAIKMGVRRVDKYNDQFPSGYVISLDPKAGTVEPPGVQVTVTVSKGKAPITVPNVVSQPYAQANQALTTLGLNVAQKQASSTKYPAGAVTAQSIDPGTGVTKGTSIILTVSTGPPLVTVPTVENAGLSYDQAAAILQKAGFTVVNMFDFPGGQVRNQNPQPNTQAPYGSQVQLWLGP